MSAVLSRLYATAATLRRLINRGEQILGARSAWQLNFVRWSLTFVGPRNLLHVTFLAPKILEDLLHPAHTLLKTEVEGGACQGQQVTQYQTIKVRCLIRPEQLIEPSPPVLRTEGDKGTGGLQTHRGQRHCMCLCPGKRQYRKVGPIFRRVRKIEKSNS